MNARYMVMRRKRGSKGRWEPDWDVYGYREKGFKIFSSRKLAERFLYPNDTYYERKIVRCAVTPS